MSFAAGFFNASSDILDENQRFIKEKRAKDRDFLMTYGVQSVTKAQEKVNNAVTVAMQLERYGVPKEEISFIVDTSGPLGLKAVYDEIKPVYDEGLLTPANLAAMMKRSKDYKPSDMTYEDMIKKTFGLYKANATDDPAENEKIGFWSALGFDSRAADSALNEQYIDGYTGRDIKRIMGTASPGLKAPVPVDFSFLPKVHRDQALMSFARSQKDRMLDDAEAYLSALAPSIAALEKLNDVDQLKHAKIKAAIAAKKYGFLLKNVPTIKSSLLDFDKETRGGLSKNPYFRDPAFETFFAQAAANMVADSGSPVTIAEAQGTTAGINAAFKQDLDDIYKQYPNLVGILNLEDIKTYETKEEWKASGDPAYILNGELRGSPSLLKKLNDSSADTAENSLREDGSEVKIKEATKGVSNSLREDGSVVKIKPQELVDHEQGAPDPLVLALAGEFDADNIFEEARVDPAILRGPNIGVRTLKGIANVLEQPSKSLAESMEGPVRQIASVIEKPVKVINESLTNFMDPLAVAIKQGRNNTSQDVSLGDIFGEWFSNTFPNFSLPENPLETVNYAAGAIRDELQREVSPQSGSAIGALPTAIELIPAPLPYTLLVYGALDTVQKEGRTFPDRDVAKQWLYEFLEKEEDFLIKSGLANYETGEYPNEQTIAEITGILFKRFGINK